MSSASTHPNWPRRRASRTRWWAAAPRSSSPGQTALNRHGVIVGNGVVEQFEQALGNLLAALTATGGTPADLTAMTVYLTDMDDYKAHIRDIGAVWRRLAGRNYPAMAGIGVARLWDATAPVEVQGFAVV